MAEFLGDHFPSVEVKGTDGFAAMGKPIPLYRQQAAYDACLSMGMTNRDQIHTLVSSMAQALERDKPYEAMQAGSRGLDLTGVYRLMAVLLTAAKPRIKVSLDNQQG